MGKHGDALTCQHAVRQNFNNKSCISSVLCISKFSGGLWKAEVGNCVQLCTQKGCILQALLQVFSFHKYISNVV